MIGKGIPDIISFTRLTQATHQLKARMTTVSEEAVTGRHADIAGATGARIGEAHLLKKGLDDIQSRISLYGVVSARIDTMITSLDGVRSAIGDIPADATTIAQTGSPNAMKPIASSAKSGIQSIFTMLNVGQGGRTLFSGDATQTTPLENVDQLIEDVRALVTANPAPADLEAALDTYFDDPAGGFRTDIYKGGDFDASSLKLSNGAMLQYGARADDQGVRDTLRGLAVLAAAPDSPNTFGGTDYRETIGNAAAAVERGREGILNAEARLGTAAQAIERAKETDEQERTILSAAYQSLVGRDQYEAAAELKQIEAQLEASYTLTARLSNLKLTNFLR